MDEEGWTGPNRPGRQGGDLFVARGISAGNAYIRAGGVVVDSGGHGDNKIASLTIWAGFSLDT